MKHYIFYFLFQIYPYICLGIFIVGTLMRYERSQYTWRASSSQLLRKHSLVWGSTLFHIGVILLLMGHFVGLLMPESLSLALGITPAQHQVMAVFAGGIFGTIAFIGLSILMIRRFFDARIRKTSTFSDDLIIVLLWIQLCLGLGTIPVSLEYPDGMHMANLAKWVQHILTFRGDALVYLHGIEWVYLAHLVLGMTLFLVFPFTRLVHIISAPIFYIWRPGYQIVRRRAKTLF